MRLMKYIFCAILALCVTTAVAREYSFELPIREHIFDNGLRLLVIERPEDTRVVGKIFTDMGALNEIPGQYGAAHFLEHLMFKGTPTLGSRNWAKEQKLHERMLRAADALEEELNRARNALRERGVFHDYQHQDTTVRLGELRALISSLNQQILQLNDEGATEKWYQAYGGTGLTATTEQEYMKFDLDLPVNRVELFLRVEADRMQNSQFRNFDAERMILVEQRLRDLNGADTAYHEAMNSLVGRASMVYVPEGYLSDFSQYTRRYERALYEQYFVVNNTTLIFIGGVTLEDMVGKVEKYFGHMQRQPEPPRYQGREPLPSAEKRLAWRSNVMSPRVELRYQIPAVGHPDRPQFEVLDKVLEPHLQTALSDADIAGTVDINTVVVHTERFGVPASINIEVFLEDAAQTGAAEALVLDEIRRLSIEPLPADEVALARKLLRSEWYRTAVDPSLLAFEIGHFEVMDSWKTLVPYLEARNQTEARDITRLIDKYFVANNRSVGVVVPEGEAE